MILKTLGYAAQSASSPLTPFSFTRREPLDKDVVIDTYNGHVSGAGENTCGGYSERIVVDEKLWGQGFICNPMPPN